MRRHFGEPWQDVLPTVSVTVDGSHCVQVDAPAAPENEPCRTEQGENNLGMHDTKATNAHRRALFAAGRGRSKRARRALRARRLANTG